MISILRATEKDYRIIADIGTVSVAAAHKDAAPSDVMADYIRRNYSYEAIEEELKNADNIYYIIYFNDSPAGFSKINLDAKHPNVTGENVTKLDRIYLLKEFQGLRLGLELLKFNIGLAKDNNQSGIWLFTWIGNSRAIDFYKQAGFEIIGSHNFYVSATHFNVNHQMYLELS